MLTKLYNKLRSSRIRPTILIKTFMKRRLFKKYAEIDGEIFLAAESDCAADKPGLSGSETAASCTASCNPCAKELSRSDTIPVCSGIQSSEALRA